MLCFVGCQWNKDARHQWCVQHLKTAVHAYRCGVNNWRSMDQALQRPGSQICSQPHGVRKSNTVSGVNQIIDQPPCCMQRFLLQRVRIDQHNRITSACLESSCIEAPPGGLKAKLFTTLRKL